MLVTSNSRCWQLAKSILIVIIVVSIRCARLYTLNKSHTYLLPSAYPMARARCRAITLTRDQALRSVVVVLNLGKSGSGNWFVIDVFGCWRKSPYETLPKFGIPKFDHQIDCQWIGQVLVRKWTRVSMNRESNRSMVINSVKAKGYEICGNKQSTS